MAAFPQAQTPLTITQSAGSATGELRMQERRTNGTDYVGIKAPQSIASSLTFALPSLDGQANDCLQTDGAGQWAFGDCGGERLVSDYNWTQVLGARSGSGAITLTFTGTNCPAAGTDTAYRYRLYETSTPTTYELATSNGTGTCVRGGAGTIVATGPTGTYTNATATSASSGWQEAVFSVADGLPLRLRAAVGGYYVYSDILTEDRYLTAVCDGPGALLVPMENGVRVLHSASPGGIRVSHCGFNNVYAKTGTKAIYTYNPDGDSFGTLLYDNNISGFATCVHLESVYGLSGYAYNRHIDCSDTALHMENPNTGDAGIGLVGPGNIFSDSVTANYGILWNGPGNLKVIGNSFNGYVKQIYGRLKMGTANVSGTAVTWASGHKFRSSYFTPTPGNFVCGSTVASVIAGYTDDENMTLTTGPVSPVTGCDYYINNTGQLLIQNNTFDSWTWTTHDVELAGDILYLNWQIQNNFSSNPNPTTFDASYKVSGANWYFGSIKGNNCQTSYVLGTCVKLDGGSYIDVSDNQVVNLVTGTAIGAGASYVMTDGNRCANANTTDCVTSAAATSIIREVTPVTYTQLAALTAANSSTLYCSNCKQTSASSATCATGGSGAKATRINGAWKCDDGSAVEAFVQGGNAFGATAELGTNDAYGLAIKINGTGVWSFPTAGHLYAGSNNTFDIGAGLSANSPRNIYAATSMVTPKIGRDSSASFTIMTDSADRWIYTSAGMMTPAATDTYDIGNLTTPLRVRGLYAKTIDTALAGGTGDSVRTRKLDIFDNTGSTSGASFWDLNVVMSGAGAFQNSYFYLRDNAGNTVWRADKIASGSPVATTTIYTDLLPDSTANVRDLGKTTQRWDEINGASLDLTGAANISGNLSAAVINATGSPAYRVNGTTVINASREATFAGLTIATGAASGYVWTSDGAGVGSWQAAAAGLPVVDTTGIAKGSSDATKIVRFEVDGLTTGTTRVLTVPDANMTLAGTDRAQTFTAAQTYNSTVAYASTISSGVSPTTTLSYDFGSSSLRWATAYVGGVNASVASTFGGNVTISGGSSLIMDRAARNTNQQFYWGVAGNVATTGAWAVGLVPSGAASTFVIAHNGTATATVSEGGQWDFAGIVTTGGSLTVTGSATANRFNATSTNPYQISGTTIVDASRNATFVGLTTSGAVSLAGSTISAGSTFSSDLIATTNATYALGSSGVRWLGYLSTLNVSSTFTFNGTLTGDIIPTTSAVYVLGSSSSLWNNIHAEVMTVYTSLLPDASASANLGGSTRRWTKTWTGDLDITGSVTAPSGGTGVSGTFKFRNKDNTGECTQVISGGITTSFTGTNCT